MDSSSKKVSLAALLSTFAASPAAEAITPSSIGVVPPRLTPETRVTTDNERLLRTLLKVKDAQAQGTYKGIVIPGVPGHDDGCLVCGTYTQGGSYTQNDNTSQYTQSDHYDPNKMIDEHEPSNVNYPALKDLLEVRTGINVDTLIGIQPTLRGTPPVRP